MFFNFDKCCPVAAGDVISGRAVESVGMDVRAKFRDSRLNSDQIIQLFGRPDLYHALLCSILLHFAADRKQLVRSYLADLWGRLSTISMKTFVILALTVLEKFHPKPWRGIFDHF